MSPKRATTTQEPGIRQSEQENHEGRTFAEALIDTVREGLLVLDTQLRVQTANTSFYTLFQVGKRETQGKLVYELGNGQWDIPELRQLLEDILPRDKTIESYEVTQLFEGLGERTMLLNARQLDSMQLILLAIEDITPRKQAEAALHHLNETLEQQVEERTEELLRSQIRFKQAFELGPVAAVMTTLEEDRFVEVNQSFIALAGYKEQEVLGRTAKEMQMWSGSEDQAKLRAAITETGSGFRELELRLRTKDGQVKDILSSGEIIKLDGHDGWLKMFVDITDRKRTEEELLKAIQEVMADTAWFSRSVVERLAKARSGTTDTADSQELTPRERQVLERIAKGLNDQAIAGELNITQQTVRNYVTNIYSKLGVHSRAEAVVWARERGIVG